MNLGRILLLTMLSLFAIPLRADSPAASSPGTQPALQNLSPREQQIRQWLSDLASLEAPFRQMARINLMSLKPSELPTLRKVCLQAVPLNRPQLESLKEIVAQLYLAGELEKECKLDKEGADNPSGFVGVRLGLGRTDDGERSEAIPGIVIYRRIIGFVGYRTLQDGDIIIGLQEEPGLHMDKLKEFTDAVGARGPGDEIHLHLIRAGKEMVVPIKLDGKPAWVRNSSRVLGDDPEDQPIDERIALANHFWETEFAVGIDPDLSDDSRK